MLFLLIFLMKEVFSTIDVNLAEFNYLANHLTENECRKLTASLHFNYEPNLEAIYEAERKVPDEISCLRLLLHWNSAKGEGLGKSHEALRRNLIIIGRGDLAEWLGKTIFKQLGEELNKDFRENVESTEMIRDAPTIFMPPKDSNAIHWTIFDTICSALIVALAAATLILLIIFCTSRMNKKKTTKKKKKGYNEIKQNDSESETEAKKSNIKMNSFVNNKTCDQCH